MPPRDPRLEVLDNARRFLRTFPVTTLHPDEEWALLRGVLGFARELLALKAPAERIVSRLSSDLDDDLKKVGISACDVEAVVKSAETGQLHGRLLIAWANKQEADRAATQGWEQPERAPVGARPQQADETLARRVLVTRASDIAPAPVTWVWQDRIPAGMVALVAGREGTGKSTMVLDRAARLTRGDLEGVHRSVPRSVIVVAAEDSWSHTIVPRLLVAGADLERVLRVQIDIRDLGVCELSLPDDVGTLAETIRAHDVAMVVLDPMISRLSRRLDTHRDAEVRLALEPLARLADETAAAVVGLIHVNKTSTRDPLTAVMGSRGFVALARAVLFVVADPEDRKRRILSQVKNNVGRDDAAGLESLAYSIEPAMVETDRGPASSSRLVWVGMSARGVRDIYEAGDSPEEAGARAEAESWLRDALEAGAQRSRDIYRAGREAGIAPRTLERAKTALHVRAHREGFGPGAVYYWELPAHAPPSETILRHVGVLAEHGGGMAEHGDSEGEDL
jgi:hypothetical protein